MTYVADLHIHSRYSRATSKDCTPEHLELWARRKGIHVLGTGDFTHPEWKKELEEKLEPAEEGMYLLKEEYRLRDGITDDSARPRFVITGEISSIYKKNGKVRKVHSVILLPGLEEAKLLSGRLQTIGNIHSDGRPILGLDCHDLLEIMLELCPDAVYIPAHIWTPHFSLFGAFSGFDTIEECFGDLTPHIHALETGLSSDPPMNWRLSALDSFQLISNSDAHSPSKLGREANLFHTPLSYPDMAAAIQCGDGLEGTIEFFPEEGKYHYDGHRKCRLCLNPSEAVKLGGKCPVCGKKLTIGVSHRVEELADRAEGFVREGAKSFESLAPLPEIIAACTGHSAAGTRAQAIYGAMLRGLGPEFPILREIPLEDIRREAGSQIAEGIRRLRAGQVVRIPGFDGEYGAIQLFEPWEMENTAGQLSMFSPSELAVYETAAAKDPGPAAPGVHGRAQEEPRIEEKLEEKKAGKQDTSVQGEEKRGAGERDAGKQSTEELNPEQQEAATARARAVAVVAGSGTGKTKTLVARVLHLLSERKVRPSEITAVTFTRKAAAEMRERLESRPGGRQAVKQMRIGTFHSICSRLLKEEGRLFSLADEELSLELAGAVIKRFGLFLPPGRFLRLASLWKTGRASVSGQGRNPEEPAMGGEAAAGGGEPENIPEEAFQAYGELLREENVLDYDDLLIEALGLPATAGGMGFSYLLVDEYQDISPLQYRLIQKWNQGGRELFVIGDPDQSIYGFRGSDSACFEKLKRDEPDLKIIRLVKNYRSAPPIIRGALAVISKNPGEERTMIPQKENGRRIRLVTAAGEMPEGIFVAKEINRLIGGIDMLDAQDYLDSGAPEAERRRYSFSDIAVLARTHRQMELLEKCLRVEGIPYLVTGRETFLAEKCVRGSICFFKSLLDPGAQEEKKKCLKLLWDLPENGVSWSVYEAMRDKYAPVAARTKPQKVMEAWIHELGLEKNAAMEKLLGMAKTYRTMAELMEDLAFGSEGDLRRCGGRSYTSDAVTVMTLHGSKGLEFPVVLLAGVTKGVIPLDREGAGQEEERRLFFVGMTRAKEELILVTSREESVFLADLPEETVRREKADKRKNADGGVQLSLFDFMGGKGKA